MSFFRKTTVLFLGSTDFSVEILKLLLKSPLYEVKGAVTLKDRPRSRRGLRDEPTPVKKFCLKQGLPVTDSWKEASAPARLAVTAGYGRILPASFLKSFPAGAVNIHPSLLPQWRGAAPVERSLMAGDKKTGVSLQIMSETVDAGDIIRQYEFVAEEEDTAFEIYEKALKISKILLLQDLPLFLKGEIQAKPQKGPLSFAPKIFKQEGKILWKEPARCIHNKIRALCKGSGAFTFLKNGERLKIFRSRLLPENLPENFENRTRFSVFAENESAIKRGNETNGQVLKAEGAAAPGSLFLSENKRRLAAAAGEGFLELLVLQKAGGKKLKASDFLRGAAPLLKDAGF